VRSRLAQPGVTLLEMLVALAVTAALGVAMYGSLAVAFQAERVGLDAVEPMRALDAAIDILAHDLQGIIPANQGPISGEFIGEELEAQAGQMTFHTTAGISEINYDGLGPTAASATTALVGEPNRIGSDVVQVTYLLLGDGDTRQLVRRVQRNLLAQVETEGEDQVLCDDVRSFELRFFDGYTWVQAWDSVFEDPPLPRAVEVVIETVPRPRSSRDVDTAQLQGRRLARVIAIPAARLNGEGAVR
jgi:general secretion pathway protein J